MSKIILKKIFLERKIEKKKRQLPRKVKFPWNFAFPVHVGARKAHI